MTLGMIAGLVRAAQVHTTAILQARIGKNQADRLASGPVGVSGGMSRPSAAVGRSRMRKSMIRSRGVAAGMKSAATAMPRPTLATAQMSAPTAQVPIALSTTPERVCSPRCSRFHTTSSTMPRLSMTGMTMW